METTTLLNDIRANIDIIMEDVASLDVANHSAVGPEWVTVAEMSDPDLARNNCWAVSNEIYENLSAEGFGVDEVDIIGVEAPGCTHYAVVLMNANDSVVVDFTARQFSPDAPFPYIVPVKVWHAYLEHVTGRELTLTLGD